MDRFNALGRGTQLMLVGAVLLFIDLFFTWQDSEEVLNTDVPVSLNGWEGIGVLLGILTIVLLAWIIVRLASVNIPLPVSNAMTAALLATLVLIFGIIKFLTVIGNDPTIWAWVGLALAIVVGVGGFKTVQEAGGVETLRTEASGLSSSMSTGGAAAAPAAAAPAAAAPTAEPEVPAAEAAPEAPAQQPGATADEASNEQGA
jgi:hypothetical protein